MNAFTIGGLDLSLTCPGAARITVSDGGIDYTTARSKATLKLGTGHERLEYQIRFAEEQTTGVDVVMIEEPTYGSALGQAHSRAGYWHAVTHGLWRRGIPYGVVNPSHVKIYGTGDGNADKDVQLSEVIRRYPGFSGGNDEADALVLAAMLADHLGYPLVSLPQTYRRALAGSKKKPVKWPDWRPGQLRTVKDLVTLG